MNDSLNVWYLTGLVYYTAPSVSGMMDDFGNIFSMATNAASLAHHFCN